MLFSDIYGLVDTKEVLINGVKNNHVAHAQLFFGKEGSANLAMAWAYATYINCTNKKENDACGECPSCHKMAKGIHPDVQFMFPNYTVSKESEKDKHNNFLRTTFRDMVIHKPYTSVAEWAQMIQSENKQLTIYADDARNLMRQISLTTFESEYKIILIWLPEYMNITAANSLLKVLEEPTKKTLFLLVTNDLDKNLTTILSRCQRFRIPNFSDEDIQQFLEKNTDLSDTEINTIIRLSENNLNFALQLANAEINPDEEYVKAWLRKCYAVDMASLIADSEVFAKRSKQSQWSFFQTGIGMMRNLLLHHGQADDLIRLSETDKDFIKKFATVVDIEKLTLIQEKIGEAQYHMERNANIKIVFVNLSVEIAKILKS